MEINVNISSILLVQCICNDSVAIFLQIILEAGVDVDVRNAQNATPLHVALNRGANLCVGLLLSAGANCNLQVNCCLYYLYNRFFLKILNRLGLSNQSFCLDFENLFFSLLANICLKYPLGQTPSDGFQPVSRFLSFHSGILESGLQKYSYLPLFLQQLGLFRRVVNTGHAL